MARVVNAKLTQATFLQLVLTLGGESRFTQDSPIMPDVWTKYACDPDRSGREDLIITAHYSSSSSDIAWTLKELLGTNALEAAELAALRSDTAAKLTFEELILYVLPLTSWWQKRFVGQDGDGQKNVSTLTKMLHDYELPLTDSSNSDTRRKLHELLKDKKERDKWYVLLLIFIVAKALESKTAGEVRALDQLIEKINLREATIGDCRMLWSGAVKELITRLSMVRLPQQEDGDKTPLVFSVNRNRKFSLTTYQSRLTVKADAAERVFEQHCSAIVWAIIDSGIDSTHPAFADRKKCPTDFQPGQAVGMGNSRVLKSYDFCRMRDLISFSSPSENLIAKLPKDEFSLGKLETLKQDITLGRRLDWELLAPLLEILPAVTPPHPHGTHVAGILGGHLKDGECDSYSGDLLGMCPDIRFYDLRVCDENGNGEEFVIIAALQFLSFVNRNRDLQVVHGANLSLSIPHEVANYACGQTPVCVQANQLSADGVVVVAAAGNLGYQKFATEKGLYESYSAMNITDPGNADHVITVGSTHKDKPHAYGVSYFSSRGPTGDGRMKPDILAPGERIYAPIPDGGVDSMDGTSMAAPHVSGAAAMLIARHKELRRDPPRIKQILCATATNLGRERNFQGAGLVDILRALQSV